MAHYYNMQAVREEIDRVPRAGHESIVYGSGARGYSDLHVFQYLPGARSATKFLIVQCKRAGGETRASVWGEGVNQLLRYTIATHGIRAVQDRRPVFGIVAIGNCLRFYEYHEPGRTIRDFARRSVHLNPGRGGICHLETHHDYIQHILDYIRTHH